MTLQEMFDRSLLDSGAFLLPQNKVEVNFDRFRLLVERCLGVYNKYSPFSTHLFKEISSSRQFTFTDINTTNVLFNGAPTSISGAPDWLFEIIPVRISGVYPFYLREYDKPKSSLDVKVEFPWEYRKPILTVPVQADYDIHAVYKHRINQLTQNNQIILQVETISDKDHSFLNLLTAKFLTALGRSRRAFTLDELPIKTDASDLVSEGQALEEKTLENLAENDSRWYLAWR